MRSIRWLAALLAVTALALGAAACGSDDDGGDDAETPAASSTAESTAIAEDVTYPLTVTDMLGRSVTNDAEPQKVAAISPTTVEYVYAVGGESVTRSTSVDFPAEATSAVDIGSAYQPNAELIAAQSPDLIVADAVLQAQLEQNLAALGVPVLYAGAANFEDVLEGLRLVGEALNKQGEGEAAATALENQLAEIQEELPETGPKVLVLNGSPQDYYAGKPESYVGDLIAQLNGDNIAAGQPDVGRFPGYTKLSPEVIVSSAPEVVLAITQGPPGGQTLTDALMSDPAFSSLPAVQDDRVTEIDADIYQQAPGPRAGEALDELAELLYPDIFGT